MVKGRAAKSPVGVSFGMRPVLKRSHQRRLA